MSKATKSGSHSRDGKSRKRRAREITDADSVEVVCRLTPYNGPNPCLRIDENAVKCVAPPYAVKRDGSSYPDKAYEFGHVFDHNDSQSVVFERCGKDLIEGLLRGKNALLFTYGVTGSGKTYTMTGKPTASGTGILPRTLDVLFNSLDNQLPKCIVYPDGRNFYGIRSKLQAHIAQKQLEAQQPDISSEIANRFMEKTRVNCYPDDYVCAVFVSYVEIFNNYCYDLLEDKDVLTKRDARQDGKGQMFVDGAVEVEVEDSNEALAVFCAGEDRRRTADTLLNKDSSRSHSVFTIRVVMSPYTDDPTGAMMPDEDPRKLVVSQLCLVDLAGSERAKRTMNVGERLAEASSINKSLMVLRQCIDKLRKNQRSSMAETVPYRDSKLTFLFKNYFEGSGKVRMVICANPRPDDFEENLNVLAFAEESQAVRVARGEERLEMDEDRPPVPRRFFSKWNNEVDKRVKEAEQPDNAMDYDVPSFAVRNSNDKETVDVLRDHFTRQLEDAQLETERTSAYMAMLEPSLRNALCVADYQSTELENLRTEKENWVLTEHSLRAQNKQLKRELDSVRDRLLRYETEDAEQVAVEQELRKSRREERRQNEQKTKTLRMAYDIVSGPSGSVAQLKQKFDANTMTASTPDLKRDVHMTPSDQQRGASTTRGERGYRQAVGTPATHGQGYMNPKYQRRSKSAPRVLSHQPLHRVPTGGILQPHFPPSARKVSRPEMSQLHKSSEYVLTHQEVDEAGNVSTSMYKTGRSVGRATNASMYSELSTQHNLVGTNTFSDDSERLL